MERWDRLEELFHAASALPGAEREAYLRQECADEGLRRELDGLLAAGDRAEGTLAAAVDTAAAELAEQLEPARAGELIGPYRILRRLGEGGMAVVYLAEQEAPVARRVALKILKVGLDTREVLQRFDAERRLLSRLVHPGIARIIDAGSTPAGRPFFVLELVEGEPITEYCDARRMRIPARIELLVRVCRAVHHAHQKGVIHRDLKPSNILVTEQDGRPTPKVIDFGIAKAIEQESAREELRTLTRHGTLLGTWEYMSPEQAAGSEDLDTRTDIYSLGVVLYEVLAGEPPFDRGRLRRGGLGELARVLAGADPPRPSARVATEHGSGSAARRGLDPSGLRRRLRGDLDRVALHCLEADRERRYSSIRDVAEDLERHLRHEPVSARAPTVRYRVAKFARRNRPLVVSAAAIAGVLIAATLVSLREARRATVQERLTAAARAAAEHGAYRSSISAASLAVELGQVQTARQVLGDIDPSLRGFEWHHLSSAIDGSTAHIAGEDRYVAATFGEQGMTVTTVSVEGSVERWPVEGGPRLGAIELGVEVRGPAAFDRGVELLAAVHGKRRDAIVLWDLRSGAKLGELAAADPPVTALALHPAGDSVAYGAKGTFIARFDGSPAIQVAGTAASDLQYSLDGARLAVATNPSWEDSGPGFLRDVDARTGAALGPEIRPARAVVWAAAFDPRRERVALGMSDKGVWLQDGTSGRSATRLRGHLGEVSDIVWNPAGDRLITGSYDWTVRVWDPGAGALLDVLRGPSCPIRALAISPEGERILALGFDGVWIWEHPRGAPTTLLLGHDSYVYGVAFAGGGARLVSASWDHTLRAWNPATGAPLGRVPLAAYPRCLRASRDGRVIACAEDDRVRVRDGALLGVIAELPAYERSIPSIDIDAAGTRIAVRTPHAAEVWSIAPPRLLRRIPAEGSEESGIAISPDGARFAFSFFAPPAEPVQPGGSLLLAPLDETAVVIAEVDGEEIVRVSGPDGLLASLAFSPDGEQLACGSWKGPVLLRDGRSGELLARLQGHQSTVFDLAYSADGRRLASGSNDTSIRLWDPVRRCAVATLSGHEEYVYALAFAPDDSCLASASGDGTVRLWATRPERERRLERGRASRARSEARTAVATRIAELGGAAPALAELEALPPSPERAAAIEALIERALAAPP